MHDYQMMPAEARMDSVAFATLTFPPHRDTVSASPQIGRFRAKNNLKHLVEFYRKATARTWPRLSRVCHIRSTAVLPIGLYRS